MLNAHNFKILSLFRSTPVNVYEFTYLIDCTQSSALYNSNIEFLAVMVACVVIIMHIRISGCIDKFIVVLDYDFLTLFSRARSARRLVC